MTSTLTMASFFTWSSEIRFLLIDRQGVTNKQHKHDESASVAPHVWDAQAPLCRRF